MVTKRRLIHVVLLFLVAACLEFSGAMAQDKTTEPSSRAEIDEQIQAALSAGVDGKFEEAVASLRAALPKMKKTARAAAQAQLVVLLDQLGRLPEAAPYLAELRSEGKAYREWADGWTERLARAETAARRSGIDPMAELILRLDSSDQQIENAASRELRNLGKLSTGAIRRHFSSLGPKGANRAVRILAEFADDDVVRFLDSLLDVSGDRDYQMLIAARAIADLPLTSSRSLAEKAAAHRLDSVRVEGFAACLRFSDLRGQAVQELSALLEGPESGLTRRVAEVFESGLGDKIRELEPAVQRLARNPHHSYASWAARLLVAQFGPHESEAAQTLYSEVLSADARREFLGYVVRERPQWTLLLAEALKFPSLHSQAVPILSRRPPALKADQLMGLFESRELSSNQAMSPYGSARGYAILLDSCAEKGAEPLARHWMNSGPWDLRLAAARYLFRYEPDYVRSVLPALIDNPEALHDLAPLILEHGSSAFVAPAVRVIESIEQGGPATRRGSESAQVESAIEVVVKFLDPATLPLIKPLIAATLSTNRISPAMPPLLDGAVRVRLARSLVQSIGRFLKSPQIPMLIEMFGSSENERTQLLTEVLKSRIESTELPELARIIRSTASSLVAKTAIDVMAAAGKPSAPLLEALVESPECLWSYGAAEALARISPEQFKALALRGVNRRQARFVNMVLEAPDSALDADLRAGVLSIMDLMDTAEPGALATWFSRLPTEEVIHAARRVLSHPQIVARPASASVVDALIALKRVRTKEAVAEAAKLLNHQNVKARLAAIEAISAACLPEGALHLVEALKDDSIEVRKSAANGLQRLKDYLDAAKEWAPLLPK